MNKIQRIEHVWSLLCERSITDSSSNNISLTNILEEVQITPPAGTKLGDELYSQEKVVPINFELITLWKKLTGKSEHLDMKIEIIDPNNKVLSSTIHPLDIKAELRRLRSRTMFNGIKITSPGEYVFSVFKNEGGDYELAGQAHLEVKIAVPKAK